MVRQKGSVAMAFASPNPLDWHALQNSLALLQSEGPPPLSAMGTHIVPLFQSIYPLSYCTGAILILAICMLHLSFLSALCLSHPTKEAYYECTV